MLGVRVAALLLLCSTPVSATEEDLSTGLKAKLEEMGVDSMQKRVHTWTTPPLQTTAQHPNCPHIPLQAGVGGVVGLVGGYLAKQTQAASMHTAHALHVHPHTRTTLHTRPLPPSRRMPCSTRASSAASLPVASPNPESEPRT